MATVGDTLNRTLRILRVKDMAEDMEAVQYETAMQALNDMMRRWEADGLQLGWSTVSNTADTMPVPPEAMQAIVFNLALVLRPEYGVQLDADVVAHADTNLAKLRMDWLSKNFARLVYPDLPNQWNFGTQAAFMAGY